RSHWRLAQAPAALPRSRATYPCRPESLPVATIPGFNTDHQIAHHTIFFGELDMADNKELAVNLKQAKKADPSKGWYFLFAGKGPTAKFIVQKTPIPKDEVASAKTLGGLFQGRCFGRDDGCMVFKVKGKQPGTAVGTAMGVLAKKAGTPIEPVFDVEPEEAEVAGAGADAAAEAAPAPAAPAAPAAAAAPAAPPAAPGKGNVLGLQKALQKLGFDPGKIDGVMGPHTQAAIKKFQQANGLAAD